MSRQLCKTHPDVDYRHHWGCPDCVRELREHNKKLVAACELVLLFHDADTWDTEKRNQWDAAMQLIQGRIEEGATTKTLCDAVRAALGTTT